MLPLLLAAATALTASHSPTPTPVPTSAPATPTAPAAATAAPSPSPARPVLPPALPWTGASERLVVAADHPWITPAERAGFATTPGYAEVRAWLDRLAAASMNPPALARSVRRSTIVEIPHTPITSHRLVELCCNIP